MLGISDLKKLRDAYSLHSDATSAETLRQIGNPSDQAIVAFAVNQMSQSDRNLRVLALRVLAHQRGEAAMRGVLAGLLDETRRVCASAIQACPNFLDNEAIVARLEDITRDGNVKRKLRRRALSMLAGDEGRLRGDLTLPVAATLRRLMAKPDWRYPILFGLVQLELTPAVKSILEDFARSNDEAERAMARRALAGERVVHIDRFANDDVKRRRIMASCDIAQGRMYYWLPR